MKNLTKLLFLLFVFCAASSLINAQVVAVPDDGTTNTDPTQTQP